MVDQGIEMRVVSLRESRAAAALEAAFRAGRGAIVSRRGRPCASPSKSRHALLVANSTMHTAARGRVIAEFGTLVSRPRRPPSRRLACTRHFSLIHRLMSTSTMRYECIRPNRRVERVYYVTQWTLRTPCSELRTSILRSLVYALINNSLWRSVHSSRL